MNQDTNNKDTNRDTNQDTSKDPRFAAELHRLCGKLRDGEITDAESQRLDQMLRDSRDARRFYRAFMALASALESRATVHDAADQDAGADNDAALLSELLQMEQAAEALPLPAEPRPIAAQAADERDQERLGWREIAGASGYLLGRALVSRPARHAYAYAAAVLLAITLIFTIATSDGPGPATTANPDGTNGSDRPADAPTAVATLTDTHDAQWAAFKLSAGDTLYAKQRLTLTEGFAEITTNQGAVALLEAPATIELLNNDNAIRLHTGKLVGICESPSSKGFVVRTTHMDITDLGTKFGVHADSVFGVYTYVFDGAVNAVKTNGKNESSDSIVLLAHQSLALNADGQQTEVENDAQVRFASALAVHHNQPQLAGNLQWSKNLYSGQERSSWPEHQHAVIFEDVAPTELSMDIPVTINRPGRYETFDESAPTKIPRGTIIRSYVVVFNSQTSETTTPRNPLTCSGSVTFNGDILGVVAYTPHEVAFSKALKGIKRPPFTTDSIDWPETAGRASTAATTDMIELSPDGRTLSYQLQIVTGVDAFRVIVRSTPALRGPA